jgi:hypothetical protein
MEEQGHRENTLGWPVDPDGLWELAIFHAEHGGTGAGKGGNTQQIPSGGLNAAIAIIHGGHAGENRFHGV